MRLLNNPQTEFIQRPKRDFLSLRALKRREKKSARPAARNSQNPARRSSAHKR